MTVRATILSAAAATMLVAPAFAEAFSARDVLTVCLTTRSAPNSIPALFLKQGWHNALENSRDEASQLLALSFLANFASGSPGQPYNPRDWAESWAIVQDAASKIVSQQAKEDWFLFVEKQSGAFLAVSTISDGPGLNIRCLLAVPEATSKGSSYHPRLSPPDARGAFLATLETVTFKTTRTQIFSVAVAVDPNAIKRELNVNTDIVAVFSTSISYPTWAVAE